MTPPPQPETQAAREEPHHRHTGVTRIIRTSDLPAGVNAMASRSSGIIYLRAGLDRITARRELRLVLSHLSRYPGVVMLPLAAWSRIRDAADRAASAGTGAAAAVQQAGSLLADHATAVIAGVVVTAGAAAAVTTGVVSSSAQSPPVTAGLHAYRPAHPVTAALSAKPLAYLGAYEPDAPRSYGGMDTFSVAAGVNANLAGYYSGWGEEFNTAFARNAAENGAWPLVQWQPDGQNMGLIVAGGSDAYITRFADEVADFGKPVVISFAHEMNGRGYSWGYGHVAPVMWIAAWRHIVNIFRGQNADNVTWLWDVNRTGTTTGPDPCAWWPGSQYVTWIGIDGYYTSPADTFASVFLPTISQVRECSGDPVLIGETSVSQAAGQRRAVADLFSQIRYSGYLGFLWFDQDQGNGQWRLETDPPAVTSLFRQETEPWRLVSPPAK